MNKINAIARTKLVVGFGTGILVGLYTVVFILTTVYLASVGLGATLLGVFICLGLSVLQLMLLFMFYKNVKLCEAHLLAFH